ncbi:MAG: carboxylase, partial [Bacteroidota bacterium]|nr:carboxylase [Bacteroidota bacterium]
FVNLVKGSYGKTPIPIDPEFRLKIAGTREEIPYNTDNYQKQPNPSFPEYGENVKLAQNEKEELLLELFPVVASKFLKDRLDRIHRAKLDSEVAERQRIEDEERKAFEEERRKYEALTDEEKRERLMNGLYNY